MRRGFEFYQPGLQFGACIGPFSPACPAKGLRARSQF